MSPSSWVLSFSGTLSSRSSHDLKHVHQQFTCVADVLGGCFPDLTDFEESNIWDLLLLNRKSGPEDDEQRDFDTPCRKMEKYFSTAIDLCGRKIVLETLFTQDERDVDEYFENLQEFKKKTMQEEMSRAKSHLKEVRGTSHKLLTHFHIFLGPKS
ncbi:hypothetical protein GOODEAATRI_022408 [Goodea atripinnis]|uniref:JMY/WHAMM N-terminal domain-containing protein n=1 Tax=Goodea atripinnis TaxID=208336 RepID=A0ABV0NMC8_9TELE